MCSSSGFPVGAVSLHAERILAIRHWQANTRTRAIPPRQDTIGGVQARLPESFCIEFAPESSCQIRLYGDWATELLIAGPAPSRVREYGVGSKTMVRPDFVLAFAPGGHIIIPGSPFRTF